MESSPSYLEMETMLRQGQVTMSFGERKEFLDLFEKKRLITLSEQEALLALAKKLNTDQLPKP